MLKEILAWWVARMRECLPEQVRALGAGSDNQPIITAEDADAVITSHRRIGGTRKPARLRLPATALLECTLTLPLAAERDLGRVLGYEIDRVTPFSPAEVFWHYDVEQRDRARARLKVRLSLVPKAPWLTLLAAIAEAGIEISAIEVPGEGGKPCRIALDTNLSRRRIWARRGLVAGAITCAALAILAIVLPFILQALALDVTERRIAALRPAVSTAEALRLQITRGAGGIDVLAAEQARTGDIVAVLTAVTNALPDDTYLTSFALRDGHLSLTGQSGAAAKLIGALSADPLFRNAAFDAPITRSDQASADIFSIRADLATPAGPKP
jgi:general secretion pathway protein L